MATKKTNTEKDDAPSKRTLPIIIALTFITLLVFGGLIFYYSYRSDIDVPVMKIYLTLEGTEDDPVCKSLDYYEDMMSLTQSPRDTPLQLPGVHVAVFKQTGKQGFYSKISQWASVKYSGAGDYELTISFGTKPQPGDPLKIQMKVVNEDGDPIYLQEFFPVWKYEPIFETKIDIQKNNGTYTIMGMKASQKWVDNSTLPTNPVQELPGVRFEVHREGKLISQLTSYSLTEPGEYRLSTAFETIPVFRDRLSLRAVILDSNGNIVTSYPPNSYWNLTWKG